MGTELIAEIYRGGGAILTTKSSLLWLPLRRYRALLVKAGEGVVKDGKISDGLQRELEKPIIPESRYIKGAEIYFRKALKKITR